MLKQLTYHQAFFAGSDLWVVTLEPKNFWFKKINWQTQFLIQTINAPATARSQSLMIATEKFFPNKAVLCIPTQKNPWIKEIYNFWVNLKKPSLRIFLRENETLDDIEKNWPEKDLIYNISYLKQYIS